MVELSKKYNFNITVIALDTPAYLDVRNVPQNLKDAALDMIDTLEKQFDPNMFSKFLTNIKNKINQPQQVDITDEFLKVTRLKDTYKNQSFDTLEIARYYD